MHALTKPWVVGYQDFRLCRKCLLALEKKIDWSVMSKIVPIQLIRLCDSKNPYQTTQAINTEEACRMCGLFPEKRCALLRQNTIICDRCIRISLELLEESADNTQRIRL
jgi:hypothetical protein